MILYRTDKSCLSCVPLNCWKCGKVKVFSRTIAFSEDIKGKVNGGNKGIIITEITSFMWINRMEKLVLNFALEVL